MIAPGHHEPVPTGRPAPPNGWVLLDRAWAERLGVQRSGGRYRIRRRDLVQRLHELNRSRHLDPAAAETMHWLAPPGPATLPYPPVYIRALSCRNRPS